MSKNTLILAIETSCDETAVSVLQTSESSSKILSNEISSQVKLHAKWGGVVPNLAAREHVKNINPIFGLSLKNAGVSMQDIDVIAVTSGPGLIPALMIGVNFAKTLAFLWEKPLIGIHHIEGHIYANFIGNKISSISNSKFLISNKFQKSKVSHIKQELFLSKVKSQKSKVAFPILCLVVSGGHTQLVFMKKHLQYEIIGQTLDDSVGEAFDKVARILSIGYPGGPAVATMAEKFQNTSNKNRTNLNEQKTTTRQKLPSQLKLMKLKASETKSYNLIFPRPMLNKAGFNFSFSGLKTAVLYETKKQPELLKNKNYIAEVCHEFQQASVDVLVAKTLKAAEKYQPKTIMLAGGVSANKELRKQLGEAIKKIIPNTKYCIPDLSLTGDNAAMISMAAAFRWQYMNKAQKKKALDDWKKIQPDANLKLK
jgi:N6-L-threonylcarbamoyladenine synthase